MIIAKEFIILHLLAKISWKTKICCKISAFISKSVIFIVLEIKQIIFYFNNYFKCLRVVRLYLNITKHVNGNFS